MIATAVAHVLLVLCIDIIFDGAVTENVQNNKENIRGHLQQLGNQNDIITGEIDEYHYTIPGRSFYRDYWKSARPVVFRGALKGSSVMKNWINDTYMKIKFGSVAGVVDMRTTWERGGVEPPPRTVMNYSDFLDRMPHDQVYWDDRIPLGHDILSDVPLGLFFDCRELRNRILYINMMTNSGNVSYVLHNDYADNLFHFIAGKKRWLIANSSFSDSLYIGVNAETPSMSPVVPDRVDLIKFPRVSEVKFQEIFLEAGDILFIPRNWPHYVQSSGFPNVGFNIWFGSEEAALYAPEEAECRRQHSSAYNILKRRMMMKT